MGDLANSSKAFSGDSLLTPCQVARSEYRAGLHTQPRTSMRFPYASANSKVPPLSEREILKAICEYLTLRGIFHWRVNTSFLILGNKGGTGKPRYVKFGFLGVGDIIGLVPVKLTTVAEHGIAMRYGRFLAIKVKRPGQKLPLNQEAFLAAVKENGGLAFVATSLDDVKRELGI